MNVSKLFLPRDRFGSVFTCPPSPNPEPMRPMGKRRVPQVRSFLIRYYWNYTPRKANYVNPKWQLKSILREANPITDYKFSPGLALTHFRTTGTKRKLFISRQFERFKQTVLVPGLKGATKWCSSATFSYLACKKREDRLSILLELSSVTWI